MVVRDPALNLDRQVEQIEDMLDMGIRVLILTPVDSDAISDVLRRARKQGVIVIVVDSNLADPSLADCTIVSDNYRAGVLAGEYLLSRMEEGGHRDIVLLTHDTALSGVQRVKGFTDTVSGRELLSGSAAAKGVILDRFTGMEARVMGEAARCAAGQKVSDMNETIANLYKIYEPTYQNQDIGKTFQECYDVTTVKPTKEYLEVYDKALQTIRDCGLDIKH